MVSESIALGPLAPDEVAIVTGLPRSGTSLVMQMLAAAAVPILADASRPADADNPRGYFECAAVRRLPGDTSWLAFARGRAVKVVVPLVRWLPASEAIRVLWIRRGLPEVLASQRVMLDRRRIEGAAQDDAALAVAFARELEQTERWLAQGLAGRWHGVEYERLLSDSRAVARGIAAFFGLPEVAADEMAAVVEPALCHQPGSAIRR